MPRGFPDLSWHATATVVVRDPLAKDSSEMAFVERDQPVETLPADCPDQALAERVGLRRSHGPFRTRSPIEATARSTAGA